MKVLLQFWWTIALLGLPVVNSKDVDPMGGFCSSYNDTDCTSAMFGEDYNGDASCTIKYYPKNSPDCSLMNFSKSPENNFDLGDFNINPFFGTYQNQFIHNFTVFNLSFSNIKWSRLKFRFEAPNNTIIKEPKNHCREIIINGSLPESFSIPVFNYDCPWSEQHNRYVNEPFILEYEAIHMDKRNYQKFGLKVPCEKYLSGPSALPFFYLNLTDSTKLDLNIVPVTASDFSVFKIEKCVNKNSSPKCENEEILNINSNIIFSSIPRCSGWHYFKITPIHSECIKKTHPSDIPSHSTCDEEICSPIFTSIIYYGFSSIVFTILWNILWICLVSGCCFTIYWMIKRHKKFTPKILLIHPDADRLHTDIINKLSRYLEIEYNWSIVQNNEIELTHHGDPYIWCLEAFMNANTVIYIDKPSDTESLNNTTGNIHVHLQEIFFKILKTYKRKKDIKLFNVMLDSHDPGAILSELKDFHTFYLPSEWQYFIHSIKRHSWIQKILIKIPLLSTSLHGKELFKAFNQS